jgi:hypothetical protein
MPGDPVRKVVTGLDPEPTDDDGEEHAAERRKQRGAHKSRPWCHDGPT